MPLYPILVPVMLSAVYEPLAGEIDSRRSSPIRPA